jgi:hypothetical protein
MHGIEAVLQCAIQLSLHKDYLSLKEEHIACQSLEEKRGIFYQQKNVLISMTIQVQQYAGRSYCCVKDANSRGLKATGLCFVILFTGKYFLQGNFSRQPPPPTQADIYKFNGKGFPECPVISGQAFSKE